MKKLAIIQKLCIAVIISALIWVPYLHIHNITNWSLNNKEMIYDLCVQSDIVKMRRKVLAYTLYGTWGKDPKWTNFMEMLAKEAMLSPLYKDWYLRLYHDENFPVELKQKVQKYKNVQICDIRTIPYYGDLSRVSGREWRFLPIGDETVDVMCSRDIDTPLFEREEAAVEEWLLSKKAFHCMRDFPQHVDFQILAGLFCFRNNKNKTLTKLVFDAIQSNHHYRSKTHEPFKVSDQVLLRDHVLPLVKNDMMQHDSYNCNIFANSTPFPSKRLNNNSGFMGCKRPCPRTVPDCPWSCRPPNHRDWRYC